MAETRIVVGHAPFSVGDEYPWLAERDEDGAVVTFTGKVRNHNLGDSVKALTLEHYPGMTEKALAEIVDEARLRWPLGRVTVIHRIGELWPGDEIVFVGVTSAHRSSAFDARHQTRCCTDKAVATTLLPCIRNALPGPWIEMQGGRIIVRLRSLPIDTALLRRQSGWHGPGRRKGQVSNH